MKAILRGTLTVAVLALSLVLAPATQVPAHKSAHKSILKVEFAERRELNVLIDDFALTDQDGKQVQFRDLRGKPLVINFMYTSCPDVCPLLTASLKILRAHMKPAEARDIRFLSITTDPEVDTPKVLRAYSKRHEADAPNWSWLSGEARELAPVCAGLRRQREAPRQGSHRAHHAHRGGGRPGIHALRLLRVRAGPGRPPEGPEGARDTSSDLTEFS